MALPSGITTATVTFSPPGSWTGANAVLDVTITPTHSLTHVASGRPIVAFAEDFSATAAVPLTVQLPHTDQPGFVDTAGAAFTNWAYTARGRWSYKGQTVPFTKSFQLPQSVGGVTDLDLLPSGNISVPVLAPTMPVTSVNGATGAVVLNPFLPDPDHPGLYLLTNGAYNVTPDPDHAGYYLIGA